MVEFIPIILIRVAFTTNLIYVVFKCNTNGRKCFFHILEYTLCDIYKCFPLPTKTSHRKKSNAEYIGKRKLFLTHVGDWLAFWTWCFITHIIVLAWKYLWVIIKLTLSLPIFNLQHVCYWLPVEDLVLVGYFMYLILKTTSF